MNEQDVLAELDGVSLRLFGPRLFYELNNEERRIASWESFRDLYANFTPPILLATEPPTDWNV